MQGFQHTLKMMIAERQLQLDELLNKAVDSFCTPENLSRVLEETVNREMKIAIESEVHKFYTYGPGRKVIAQAVLERLEENHNIKERADGR